MICNQGNLDSHIPRAIIEDAGLEELADLLTERVSSNMRWFPELLPCPGLPFPRTGRDTT
jgi:hypothetical protein